MDKIIMSSDKSANSNWKPSYSRMLAGFFVVQFLITLVILLTDMNLRNDFGFYTGSGYFIHWWGLLVTAVVDVLGVGLLIFKPSRTVFKIGAGWSIFMVAFLFGDILLYKEVGFSTPTQFADYLFGFSKYPSTESYYPGLYAVLAAIYIIIVIFCLVLILSKREKSLKQ
jgi:hypothetical protein